MTDLIVLEKGKLTPTGLTLPAKLVYEQWESIGKQLRLVGGAIQWAIGDWLNYGEEFLPDKYSQALNETDYEYGTLRNYAYVARKVALSFRSAKLTFAHHYQVASLPCADQRAVLAKAEKEHLTVKALKALLEGHGDQEKIGVPSLAECIKALKYIREQEGISLHIKDVCNEAITGQKLILKQGAF